MSPSPCTCCGLSDDCCCGFYCENCQYVEDYAVNADPNDDMNEEPNDA